MNMTHPKVTGSAWELPSFRIAVSSAFVYEIPPEKITKYKLYLEYYIILLPVLHFRAKYSTHRYIYATALAIGWFAVQIINTNYNKREGRS